MAWLDYSRSSCVPSQGLLGAEVDFYRYFQGAKVSVVRVYAQVCAAVLLILLQVMLFVCNFVSLLAFECSSHLVV